MASNYDTESRTRTKNISQIRRIKVSQSAYYRTVTNPNHPACKHTVCTNVPAIRISGKWLECAGFSMDTPVKVRVMDGCLVLTTED